ncbi:putative transmembrane protein [Sesbania bispinosa]|nr:putative transmembrane protein [Sesbania bispinosa]
MASSLKFSMLTACVLVLIVVAAAQYGGGPDYDSAPSPSASPRSLSYPALIIMLLPFMLTTFLLAKQRI